MFRFIRRVWRIDGLFDVGMRYDLPIHCRHKMENGMLVRNPFILCDDFETLTLHLLQEFASSENFVRPKGYLSYILQLSRGLCKYLGRPKNEIHLLY